MQHWRRTGSVPMPQPRWRYRWRLDAHQAWLLALVEAEPGLTLAEIRARLRAARGLETSVNSLWRFFDRHGRSFKKTVLADEQARADVAAARQRWKAHQQRLDPEHLVFVDETWAKTNMIRSHGRCARGQRLPGRAPHGHWKTSTCAAGLRHDAITAPLVIDWPMNGLIFKTYVERCLAPTLKPGDIVIMDNIGGHKSQAVRDAIMAQGAHLLFLPPYSPHLNPIEKLFSKLKTMPRAAAERTIDELWKRIGSILDLIKPDQCANYFRHADYA